jgi:hypothetical protein
VLQYEWSIFDPVVTIASPFRIHHRALSARLQTLHEALIAQPERLQNWSQQTSSDLSNIPVLSRLLLKAALLMNPESVILFSSKQARRIQANAAVSDDSTLDKPARRLYELIHAETAQSF